MDLSPILPHLADLAAVVIAGIIGWLATAFRSWLAARRQVEVSKVKDIDRERIHKAAKAAVDYAISKIGPVTISGPNNSLTKFAMQYMMTLMAQTLEKNELTPSDVEKIIESKVGELVMQNEQRRFLAAQVVEGPVGPLA